jgi:hypothetical protein
MFLSFMQGQLSLWGDEALVFGQRVLPRLVPKNFLTTHAQQEKTA